MDCKNCIYFPYEDCTLTPVCRQCLGEKRVPCVICREEFDENEMYSRVCYDCMERSLKDTRTIIQYIVEKDKKVDLVAHKFNLKDMNLAERFTPYYFGWLLFAIETDPKQDYRHSLIDFISEDFEDFAEFLKEKEGVFEERKYTTWI